jgi:hypothetical protein
MHLSRQQFAKRIPTGDDVSPARMAALDFLLASGKAALRGSPPPLRLPAPVRK